MSRTRIVAATCAALVASASMAHAVTYINDNFSTFAAGNLVGQSSWTQLGASTTSPLQVSGGKLQIPYNQTVDNQDAYKNLSTSALSLYPTPDGSPVVNLKATFTVNDAPYFPTYSTSYVMALSTNLNGGSFANYRIAAEDIDNTHATGFLLGSRITGQAGDPWTFGAVLAYGVPHNIEMQIYGGLAADGITPAGTDFDLYVDGNYYLHHNIGAGGPPASVGSVIISQFGNATGTPPTRNAGVSISSITITPEPASLALLAVGLLFVRRR